MYNYQAMAVVVKLVNTPDCGSGTRGFESRCPLQRLFNPVSQGAGFFMRGQRAGRIGRAGMLYQGYKIDSNARGGA